VAVRKLKQPCTLDRSYCEWSCQPSGFLYVESVCGDPLHVHRSSHSRLSIQVDLGRSRGESVLLGEGVHDLLLDLNGLQPHLDGGLVLWRTRASSHDGYDPRQGGDSNDLRAVFRQVTTRIHIHRVLASSLSSSTSVPRHPGDGRQGGGQQERAPTGTERTPRRGVSGSY
jgi:hypothetical protein